MGRYRPAHTARVAVCGLGENFLAIVGLIATTWLVWADGNRELTPQNETEFFATLGGKGPQAAKRRVGKYSLSFRRMALERMKDCASVSALVEELGIDRSLAEYRRQCAVFRLADHQPPHPEYMQPVFQQSPQVRIVGHKRSAEDRIR